MTYEAATGSRALDDLFSVYLKAGGDWLSSTLCCKIEKVEKREMKGEEHYIRLCDLREKEGSAAADEIFKAKQALQDELPEDSEEPPFILKHPDLPGCKAGLVQSLQSKVPVMSELSPPKLYPYITLCP